jgi:hypothetical protein
MHRRIGSGSRSVTPAIDAALDRRERPPRPGRRNRGGWRRSRRHSTHQGSRRADFIPRSAEVGLTGPVVAFLAAVTAAAGLLFGLIPALHGVAFRLDGIQAGGRASTDAAGPRRLRRMVVGQGMGVVGLGIVLGLAGALAFDRFLSSLLFEVGATEPLIFLCIWLIMLGVALAGCLSPARRAAILDPAATLREE